MQDRSVYETDRLANIAKLEQLIFDAYQKELEGGQDKAYWIGVGFGLRRALCVIQGRG